MLPISLTLALLVGLLGADPRGEVVLSETTEHFAHLDIDITVIKTLDPQSGLITRTAYGSDGFAVDYDTVRMDEQALKIATRGKISPELGRIMDAAAPGEALPVAFWLDAGDEPGLPDREGIRRHSRLRIVPEPLFHGRCRARLPGRRTERTDHRAARAQVAQAAPAL